MSYGSFRHHFGGLQVGDAGAIPLLVQLLSSENPAAQDSALGALANLAIVPRCRELIADAHGIAPLVQILGLEDVDEGVKELATGTLTNLAILPANQACSTTSNQQM